MATRQSSEDQELCDKLSDLYMHCVSRAITPGFACKEFADRVASLMELAAGRQFEVKQIVPPPTQPRQPRKF